MPTIGVGCVLPLVDAREERVELGSVVQGDAVPAVPGVLDEVGRSVSGEYCPVDRVPLDGAGEGVMGCGGVGLGDPVAVGDVAGSPLGVLELDERSMVGLVVAVAGAEL